MAERRTTRQLKAREKARARTAERRQREQQLEDLATAWFEAEDEIANKESAAEEKIRKYTEKVRGEVEKETGKLREQMNDVVGKMLALTGVRSVAERLGVPEAAVTRDQGVLGRRRERSSERRIAVVADARGGAVAVGAAAISGASRRDVRSVG